MQKLQARNISDDLYGRVAAAAARNDRSLEGEVRQALAAAYPATGTQTLTLRQQWQQETARRLRQLVAQLHADDFWQFRGPGTTVQLARHLGEDSPARVFDWMDGLEPLPFEAAERIAAFTGCSRDWLMEGRTDPFSVTDIGNPADYEQFFCPEGPGDYRFYLIRFGDGNLLCIRHDRSAARWSAGHMGGRFCVQDGMGGGGMGNLKRFLKFLKACRIQLKTDSCERKESSENTGLHHPVYFTRNSALTLTDWLQQLLQGNLPESWTADASELRYILEEVRDAPDGSTV
ncbi:FitA-like ribbon-helix-helix domain-containing protein [Pantoea stewartii]|uniref:FitA-like ribbon-helix-helix domain-containing protein n=1 Tax=Pantoea stewartii TaxID=66269 RepID=UPI0019820051|nr:hypothetical protein [Pantoea stewartii]